jgi:hypothetical protein
MCVPQVEELLTLSDVAMASGNEKWYDYGRVRYFMKSPSGAVATSYLFVEYEIELIKPAAVIKSVTQYTGHAYWTNLGDPVDVPNENP